MPAPRAAAAATVLCLLAATLLHGAPQVEADPHDLYDRARAHVSEGELKEAAATITRLRALIESRPGWDPEGVFAKRLLPPLQSRLNRLLNATQRLDEYSERSLRELRPPTLEKDLSTVRDYTGWATSIIQRLREERDAVVAAALRDPEEVAILARTESWRRSERVLQVDVLERLSESAGDDVLGLLGGDADLESVLVRFKQLKRQLMQVASERDQLRQDAAVYRERTEEVLEALLEVVTDGARVGKGSPGRPAAGVADRFRLFLDDERQALALRTSLRWWEREALLANVNRYRRYNAVLRAAGLGQDEGARIDALSRMVADLPVSEGADRTAPGADRALLLIACGLALATLILGGLVLARRKPGLHHPPAREVSDEEAA